jgi:hypothetical protein
MKLISFDVGIKNMAFCIFDVSGSQYSILEWNILNLMENQTNMVEKTLCNCSLKPKNKKTTVVSTCNTVAKYFKGAQNYCEKHAKSETRFSIPSVKCSQKSIKKMKMEGLLNLCVEYHLLNEEERTLQNKLKKSVLLEKLENFLLEPILYKKGKTAKEVNLIEIGRNIKKLLDQVLGIDEITHVLIENQISPIANRMKTIQGMLAQYFIMKGDVITIDFISSANKLSGFITSEPSTDTKYKQNKQNGVILCSQILEKMPNLHCWKPSLDTKKKDDLADCFLQGIWYLNKNKLIV